MRQNTRIDVNNGPPPDNNKLEDETIQIIQRIVQNKPKIREPDLYNRERNKLKTFFIQYSLYLHFNQKAYRQDINKIMFITSYLRGYTQNWVQPFLTDYIDYEPRSKEDTIIEIFTSVAAFKEKLS